MNSRTANNTRWRIAIAGTCLQLCLGTVYAWSYFQKPLVDQYGWANTQVAWAFSLAICFLGLAAAWGGRVLPAYGPRRLAMAGGALFSLGYLLAALALHLKSLPLLYIGYGVIGGSGLGLGYVTPVATAAKWFPDKKGLVTGMVVMGFGFGALLMSKVFAPLLMKTFDGNLVTVFGMIGVVFAIVSVAIGSCLRNPPPDFVPPVAAASSQPMVTSPGANDLTPATCLLSGRFMMMWLVFFCNILAGISIISFQSPLFQDLWRRTDAALSAADLAGYGATLIAVSSLFNGIGRLFWGSLSDRIGRPWAFRIMLASQIVAFGLLIVTANPWLFGALICYILLCYGGGFGTMPSFILDTFGPRLMAAAYGVILTAWSAAGIAGPQIVALLKDHCAAQASRYAFEVSAGFLFAGLVFSFILNNQPFRRSSKTG